MYTIKEAERKPFSSGHPNLSWNVNEQDPAVCGPVRTAPASLHLTSPAAEHLSGHGPRGVDLGPCPGEHQPLGWSHRPAQCLRRAAVSPVML